MWRRVAGPFHRRALGSETQAVGNVPTVSACSELRRDYQLGPQAAACQASALVPPSLWSLRPVTYAWLTYMVRLCAGL